MIDAFLQLTTADGKTVEGECADSSFLKAIEIRGFGLGAKASGPGLDIGVPSVPLTLFDDIFATADKSLGKLATGLSQTNKAELDRMKRQHQEITQRTQQQLREQTKKLVQTNRKSSALFRPDQKTDVRAEVENEIRTESDDGAGKQTDRMTFQIRKDIDSASADLFQAYCATIQHPMPKLDHRKLAQFSSATVSFRRAGGAADTAARGQTGTPFLVCRFADLFLTAYDLSFDGSRETVTESVTFSFVQYILSYQTQDASGAAGAAKPEVQGSIGDD